MSTTRMSTILTRAAGRLRHHLLNDQDTVCQRPRRSQRQVQACQGEQVIPHRSDPIVVLHCLAFGFRLLSILIWNGNGRRLL